LAGSYETSVPQVAVGPPDNTSPQVSSPQLMMTFLDDMVALVGLYNMKVGELCVNHDVLSVNEM